MRRLTWAFCLGIPTATQQAICSNYVLCAGTGVLKATLLLLSEEKRKKGNKEEFSAPQVHTLLIGIGTNTVDEIKTNKMRKWAFKM